MKSLSTLNRKIKAFFKLDFESKKLFIKAFFLSGFYRFIILNRDFSKVKKSLGHKGMESTFDEGTNEYRVANKIGQIVRSISRYTPWESKCLVQAMTAQKLLNEKGIKSTLYLGVAKKESSMIAHSWLRCGKLFVTGGNGDLNYIRVNCFSK